MVSRQDKDRFIVDFVSFAFTIVVLSVKFTLTKRIVSYFSLRDSCDYFESQNKNTFIDKVRTRPSLPSVLHSSILKKSFLSVLYFVKC